MSVLGCLEFEPEALITIDLESYYDLKTFTLKKLSTESYIRDPRFEALGIGVQLDDGEPVWMEIPDFVRWAKTIDWSRVAVAAHNCPFDAGILAFIFGIIPGFYFCTLKMARAHHAGLDVGGSLGKLMKHYGVGEKGDEIVRANGKRRKDFTPEEFAAYGHYCCTDTRGCYDILQKMLAEGFPEVELWNIDTTIRMFTEPKFHLNVPKMVEYHASEIARKRELLRRIARDATGTEPAEHMTEGDLIAAARDTLMSNEKFAVLLMDLGVEPPEKISVAKTKTARLLDPECDVVMTYAFAKADPGMQELIEHPNSTIAALAEARVAVKSTINETRTKRLLDMAARGQPIPFFLKYAGAHTFRWSGADRINAQNFERTSKTDPYKGVIRQSLCAPPGYAVVVSDSAQIEARMLAWLAEDAELLTAFADESRDVYSEFASEINGRPVDRKRVPGDFIAGFIAKCCVLGLGYGLGWLKFAQMLLAGMLGGPRVQFTQDDADLLGVNMGRFVDNAKKLAKVAAMPSRLDLDARVVHCAVAEAIVYRWRDKNKKITEWWRMMNDVLAAMETGEGGTFGPGDCLTAVRHGIKLPNGLVMYYPGLEASEDYGYSYLKPYSKERVRLYPGLITENIDQALSRIVVSDQMLRFRGHSSWTPSLFTHDELVYVVPEPKAAEVKKSVNLEMRVPSEWCPTLPLFAETGCGPTYGSAK